MGEDAFSSPACLAHEADALYMGLLGAGDLPGARAELSACAAACVRLARAAREQGAAPAGLAARAARLARAAAGSESGPPESAAGAREGVGAAALAFEARRSAARLRPLAARMPERSDDERRLARALRAAVRAHELLIAAIELDA
ncbi:hypothetical protein [Methylocella sp.]|uniref:hypothetical protein n=1 Tax=Methylocella sp. TaxID=1978226 RepID=UPI0035B03375